MRTLSRWLHKIEVPSDWWMFQGGWPAFLNTLFHNFVLAGITIAILFLATYWIGVILINLNLL